MIVALTTVALPSAEGLRAVGLIGPSGVGKSDLALRLMEAPGAALISDDQTLMERVDETLIARPAPAIEGLIEARGLGPLPAPFATAAPLVLLVACQPKGFVAERAPALRFHTLLGLDRPVISLIAVQPSAPAIVRLALAAALSGRLPGMGEPGTRA